MAKCDFFDKLCWAPWPEDDRWMFTNVPGVARVAFNEYGRFWMYELNEDGKRVGGPYRDMTRDQALGALVSIIIRRCGLF